MSEGHAFSAFAKSDDGAGERTSSSRADPCSSASSAMTLCPRRHGRDAKKISHMSYRHVP